MTPSVLNAKATRRKPLTFRAERLSILSVVEAVSRSSNPCLASLAFDISVGYRARFKWKWVLQL